MFQTKVVEKIKTHVLNSTTFFWQMVPFMRKCERIRYCRADHMWLAICRSRFACWIPKATNTHSKHLILIALLQQQWLRERASLLRYTFSACLVTPQLRHRNVCSLLIRVLVLCHEPSRRNCSHRGLLVSSRGHFSDNAFVSVAPRAV